MASFIQTKAGITVMVSNKPITIASDHPHFDELIAKIKADAPEQEIEDIIFAELRRMEQAVEVTPEITIKGGCVYYQGEQVHGSLADRMVQMLHEGFDLTPMVAFLNNLMENPSFRAVQDLYGFLEYGQMPITPDGHFLAYKAVRPDWLDIHSGTMDNSVGKVVQMTRNKVDENPERTCSYGLHVCSFDYLPHFAHANGHVVICKINPRDVVAIPKDYNNTKMRVSRYEVVDEFQGYYQDQGNILAGSTVRDQDKPFRVEVCEGDAWETYFPADTLIDAANAMQSAKDETWDRVRIVNVLTGVIVDEWDAPDSDFDPDFDSNDDQPDDTPFVFYVDKGQGLTEEDRFADKITAVASARNFPEPYREVRVILEQEGADDELIFRISYDQ